MFLFSRGGLEGRGFGGVGVENGDNLLFIRV